MKSNHSFQQEGHAPDLATEPQADIFNTLKPVCSPKKRLTRGDLWMIQKTSRRRTVTNDIRYCF
jgi:hypothetical protein